MGWCVLQCESELYFISSPRHFRQTQFPIAIQIKHLELQRREWLSFNVYTVRKSWTCFKFLYWINISYCCTTFPTTMGRGQLRHSIIQLACLGIIQVCVSGLKEWTYVSTAGVQTTRGVNACTTHSSMVANSSRILR